MIGLPILYDLTGAMFICFALGHLRARAWRSALFWGLFAVLLVAGSWIPDVVSGCMVLVMALLAVMGLKPAPVESVSAEHRAASAARLGNRLFLPALAVPAVTVAGTFLLPLLRVGGKAVVDPAQVTLAALAIGAAAGLSWAMAMLERAFW